MSAKIEAFKNALYAYEFGIINEQELNKRIYTLNNTPKTEVNKDGQR